MKILKYLTHDEVNEDQARRTVEACGAQLVTLWIRDQRPKGQLEASLVDLDSLPPDNRRDILAGLLTHAGHRPVGVHMSHLDEQQARALRHNGVRVSRRLHQNLIRELLND